MSLSLQYSSCVVSPQETLSFFCWLARSIMARQPARSLSPLHHDARTPRDHVIFTVLRAAHLCRITPWNFSACGGLRTHNFDCWERLPYKKRRPENYYVRIMGSSGQHCSSIQQVAPNFSVAQQLTKTCRLPDNDPTLNIPTAIDSIKHTQLSELASN